MMKPIAIRVSAIGWIVLTLGCGMAIYFAVFFGIAVRTKSGEMVVNLGLMSDRQSGLMLAAVAAGVGAVLAFTGKARVLTVRPIYLVIAALPLVALGVYFWQGIWLW